MHCLFVSCLTDTKNTYHISSITIIHIYRSENRYINLCAVSACRLCGLEELKARGPGTPYRLIQKV